MWKAAVLATFLGVVGRALARHVQKGSLPHDTGTATGAGAKRDRGAQTPAKVVYLHRYRQTNQQHGRAAGGAERPHADVLKEMRATIDSRVRAVIERRRDAA